MSTLQTVSCPLPAHPCRTSTPGTGRRPRSDRAATPRPASGTRPAVASSGRPYASRRIANRRGSSPGNASGAPAPRIRMSPAENGPTPGSARSSARASSGLERAQVLGGEHAVERRAGQPAQPLLLLRGQPEPAGLQQRHGRREDRVRLPVHGDLGAVPLGDALLEPGGDEHRRALDDHRPARRLPRAPEAHRPQAGAAPLQVAEHRVVLRRAWRSRRRPRRGTGSAPPRPGSPARRRRVVATATPSGAAVTRHADRQPVGLRAVGEAQRPPVGGQRAGGRPVLDEAQRGAEVERPFGGERESVHGHAPMLPACPPLRLRVRPCRW